MIPGTMRGAHTMVFLVSLVLASGGCARPDWIERTLVTTDVTGTWFGISEPGGGTGRVSLWLDLKQDGPKVTGTARTEGGGGASRLIEGTVAGDGFTFHESQGTPVKGEVTVSGDQMTGDVYVQSATNTYRVLQLRRAGSGPGK